MAISDTLARYADPLASKDEREDIRQDLARETAPEVSMLGSGLGGVGGAALGLAATLPLGRMWGRKKGKDFAKWGGSALADLGGLPEETKEALRSNPELLDEMLKRSGSAVSKQAEKLLEELKNSSQGRFTKASGSYGLNKLKDFADSAANHGSKGMENASADIAGLVAGLPGAWLGQTLGSRYGADVMRAPDANPEAEKALDLIADPNTPPEEKKKLIEQYQLHYTQRQQQQGSGLARFFVENGFTIPASMAFTLGASRKLGERLMSDKALEKSWIASTPIGREGLVDFAGDILGASSIGTALGAGAYNLTGNDQYVNPFEGRK